MQLTETPKGISSSRSGPSPATGSVRPGGRRPSVGLAALVVAALVSACSTAGGSAAPGSAGGGSAAPGSSISPPPAIVEVSCEAFAATPTVTQAATLSVGETLTVTLCANPTTGYAWGTPQLSDPKVVEVVSSTYQAPDATSPPIVGAAGRQLIIVRGLAAGPAAVTVSYARPFASSDPAIWSYRLNVTVR